MKRIILVVFAVALSFVVSGSNGSAQEWNQWRGPHHDGKSLDSDLLASWPKKGPELLWQQNGLGEGFANLCFWGDRIYTTGDFNEQSFLLFLDRATGKAVKRIEIGKGGPVGGYPGPKSTPVTDGKFVYALNQNGLLICADAATAEVVWRKNLYDDFGGTMPSNVQFNNVHWGYAGSPLLDGERLICMPGGPQGTVLALNKTTGEKIWQSKELTDPSPYCTIVFQEIEGVPQYLVQTVDSIAGIAPEDGKLLWQAKFPGKAIVCTDPVFHDGIVFATCAYKVGSYAYRISKNGSDFSVKEIYSLKKIDNKHHGLMLIDGCVYSSTDRGSFACIDIKTGNIKWEERKLRGKAAVSFADGKLILRKENTGELILVKPSPRRYTEVSRFQQPDRSDRNAWTYPLVVDKKMYVRDQDKLFCYDLAK